jgi:hypothetical protein
LQNIPIAEQYELAGMSDLIIDIDDVYFDVLDHKPIVFNFFTHLVMKLYINRLTICKHVNGLFYTLSVYAYMYELEF